MSQETTALAESRPKSSPNQLKRYQFKPGTSGNPGGRPKGHLVELKELAKANVPIAIKRLGELINSRDERIALEAVQLAYLYSFGKPPENRELMHQDTLQARHTELVAVPLDQPQLEPPLASEQTIEAVEAPATQQVLTAPEPPEAAGDVTPASAPSGLSSNLEGASTPPGGQGMSPASGDASKDRALNTGSLPGPHFLRCLYRGKDGQCQESALETSQWCAGHRKQLFSLVPE